MNPHANQPGPSRSQQAIYALNSALRNPYQYSSHYAQAYYSQQQNPIPMTTPEGYSISSTYNANGYQAQPQTQQSYNRTEQNYRGRARPHPRSGAGRSSSFGRTQHQQAHRYEPGNDRCTYEQCNFTGSKKSVEIHMMDRHLIYPPGWENRRRKPDWDADPSLNNGKPMPIQGTSVVLDSPETIAAWIEERKKRFPTRNRVEEKEKKLKEAIERGEIAASDPAFRGRKRPNPDDRTNSRGQPSKRGRGAARPTVPHPLPKKPDTAPLVSTTYDELEDSGSGSDMDPEKDAISSKPPEAMEVDKPEENLVEQEEEKKNKPIDTSEKKIAEPIKPAFRKPAAQPKAPLSNPFSNHSSLLRNLLLPEIRMTVSNLSQAIHFLVENDFLRDVELKPGEIDENPIQVISETSDELSPP